MKRFDGKNVYISGGSSGIGLAAAERFSSLGANVFIFSIDQQKQLDGALTIIKKAALRADQSFEAIALDVTDHEDVSAKLTSAIDRFGAPYVLINSAGMGGAIPFEELSFERFDRIMKVNLYGCRNTVAACLVAMKAEGGYICNISSMSGLVGIFGYTAYASAKFGVVGFSQALRSEMKQYGIQVSVMCPVQVDTPMIAETDRYKPPETKAVNDRAGLMTTEEVVQGMLKGMLKNRAVIIPGAKGKFVHLVQRLLPSVREGMTDRIIRRVQRERQAAHRTDS